MKKLLFVLLLLPVFAQGQIITTIAGSGTAGFSGDGGAATAAQLSLQLYPGVPPNGVAVDGGGNVYIADVHNGHIRKVSASTGIITTVAANATDSGCAGTVTGVSALTAGVGNPFFVAADDTGNFYTSCANPYLQKVTAMGDLMSTIADQWAADVAIDPSGNIYISDNDANVSERIAGTGAIVNIAGNGSLGFSGDGGPAVLAELSGTNGLAIDAEGNIYIADAFNQRVRKVSASTGIITTIAGSGSTGYSGDGAAATLAELNTPNGVAVDDSGNVYIADFGNNAVRKISHSTGVITTIAGTGIAGYSGDGGDASAAQLNEPGGVAVDAIGNVYIYDMGNNRIRKITAGTSGVNNVGSLQPLAVFPNPATTSLTVRAPYEITTVAIYNLIGQVVCTSIHNAARVQVDIATLPSGVYLVKINGAEVRRFVKQ